jgi:hypothetical protein
MISVRDEKEDRRHPNAKKHRQVAGSCLAT